MNNCVYPIIGLIVGLAISIPLHVLLVRPVCKRSRWLRWITEPPQRPAQTYLSKHQDKIDEAEATITSIAPYLQVR